jgi:hypothetical protein
MANLGKENGVYLARFRYQGHEYKKSLKTSDVAHARAALRRVEDALHWLTIGHLAVPAGIDPGDFVVSGGQLRDPRSKPRAVPTLDAAVREYTTNLGHLAVSNRATVRTRLSNLQRKLKGRASVPLDRIEKRELEAFVQARLKERSSTTVAKKRVTVMQFFGSVSVCG